MNVIATSYFDNYANYQLGWDLLSTNLEVGYHTIRIYGVLNVTGNNISWSSGTARILDTVANIGTYYSNGSYTLVTKDQIVYINDQGQASMYVDGSINTTYKSGSCGGDVILPDVQRFPTLINGTDFKDNENPVFNIKAYGNYDIRVRLEYGGNPYAQRNLTSKNSQVYTLELTDNERETLRGLMTGDSMVIKEVVVAVQNGQEVNWSAKEYTMTKGSNYFRIRVNNAWKSAIPYVRVNGQWKQAKPYLRINNNWKEGI